MPRKPVTVQMTAASRADSSLREPSAFFLVMTGPAGHALGRVIVVIRISA